MGYSIHKEGYNRRPVWQLVGAYLIIGAIMYGVINSVFFAKKSNDNSGYASGNTKQQSTLKDTGSGY